MKISGLSSNRCVSSLARGQGSTVLYTDPKRPKPLRPLGVVVMTSGLSLREVLGVASGFIALRTVCTAFNSGSGVSGLGCRVGVRFGAFPKLLCMCIEVLGLGFFCSIVIGESSCSY